MGTVLEISAVTTDPELLDMGIERVSALERVVSRWRPESETSSLNAAGGHWRPVSEPMRDLLDTALRLHTDTAGAFDVTVGPAIALWTQAERAGMPPTVDELGRVQSLVDAARIEQRAGQARMPAGARLDFGGLAKGWALDRLETWLRSNGVEHALLNFGGSSLAAIGSPPNGPAWRVLVEMGEGEAGILTFSDQHISVSHSLGQARSIGGKSYGHVIDPRTARTLDHAAVVIAAAESGANAEAWSTALLVRGREGVGAAEAHDLSVWMRDSDGVRSSPAFPSYQPLPARP